MERMVFNSNGKLISIDNSKLETFPNSYPSQQKKKHKLKTSDSLNFLEEEQFDNIFEKACWSLHSEDKAIPPLIFSNGKTQEDIVKEILNLIKEGTKVIFLHGTCGTGKSAIALNVARILGKSSIIVPVKALQRQYEHDYIENKYLIKSNGSKMKIAMVTGKENHDSLIKSGSSCADPSLPENIKFTEKNYSQILEYYRENPFISNKEIPDIKSMRRISIAPANPYWSPILPASIEINMLRDSLKKRYLGCDGKEYIFYHRKRGCSYYDQYMSYIMADAIIFNSAKYKSELSIGRKPLTEVDIIDEADEFLDSLFQQEELNLSRLSSSLKLIFPEDLRAVEQKDKILSLIELEEKNKRALGIDENHVFKIEESKIREILQTLSSSAELEGEIVLDELNYSNKALEISKNITDYSEVYLTYRKEEENLFAKLVSTNLAAKFKDILNKTKALILMSGTLHSDSIIKNIFKIEKYKIVEAETLNIGSIEITKTGKEFDCKYSNFKEKHSREDYLSALSSSVERAEKPILIHVNAFQDLPKEDEKESLNLFNLMSSEKLKKLQEEDKTGRAVSIFKKGLSDSLFTTKCSRGIDFPGDTCRSIVFTKFPNPNISDTFWKILQRTHPEYFWEFYKDKAHREFLQRIFRAVRSRDDHVKILSPDLRVLDAVKTLQTSMLNQQNTQKLK